MLNAFTTAYNALQGKPGIEYVARLRQQLHDLESGQQPDFACPAVFIEFTDVTYGTQHYNTQVGSATLRIYVVQTEIAETDETFFTLRDTIHKALQATQATPDVGRFNRVAENAGPDVQGLSVWTMDYAVSWNDDSAAAPLILHAVGNLTVTTTV